MWFETGWTEFHTPNLKGGAETAEEVNEPVLRWPGVAQPGHMCDSLLYNVDLAPTLCDLLGIPAPEDWDGRSFGENAKGRSGLDLEYLVWGHGLYTVQRAVRTKTHLMVRTYDDFGYPFEPVELYDMIDDPYQTRNLRDECPEVVRQCDHHLMEWIHEQLGKGHAVPDPMVVILEERGKVG